MVWVRTDNWGVMRNRSYERLLMTKRRSTYHKTLGFLLGHALPPDIAVRCERDVCEDGVLQCDECKKRRCATEPKYGAYETETQVCMVSTQSGAGEKHKTKNIRYWCGSRNFDRNTERIQSSSLISSIQKLLKVTRCVYGLPIQLCCVSPHGNKRTLSNSMSARRNWDSACVAWVKINHWASIVACSCIGRLLIIARSRLCL